MSKRSRLEHAGPFLASTTLQAVMPRHHRFITTLNHSDSVQSGLDELAARHILSAPVTLAPSVEDDDSGTYLGMLDCSAILRAALLDAEEEAAKSGGKKKAWELLPDVGDEFLSKKLIQVCGQDVVLAYKASSQQSLQELITDHFLGVGAVPHAYVHRVAIFDSRARVVGLVSQSDVIRFLALHTDELGEEGSKTLEQLEFVRDVVSVDASCSAAEAFAKMVAANVSSVAVVAADGEFLCSLGSDDLRGLRSSTFPLLAKPVAQFLVALHGHTQLPVTARPGDRLSAVLKRLAQNRLHRMYILDAKKSPVGILTLTDAMRALVN